MTAPTQTDWFNQPQPRQSVPGYLHEVPARAISGLLSRQAADGLTGALAEIGVFYGNLFIGLARASQPGEVCLGVDPFEYPGKANFKIDALRLIASHTDATQQGRVRIIDRTSDQITEPAWRETIQSPLRFAHLDGNHTRASIMKDLSLATSWLASDAVVVFDDLFNELHPDVTTGIIDGLRATDKLMPIAVIPRVGSLHEGGSKLVCCVPGRQVDYVEAIDAVIGLQPSTDRFLGRQVRTYWPPKPATRTV